LPAKPACVGETYSELGEGDIAGKNDIFDIRPVIGTPLTSPPATRVERKEKK
jgi:hypothetical protein